MSSATVYARDEFIDRAADALADNPKLHAAVAEACRRVRAGQWDARRAVMIALLDYLDLAHADDLWAAVDLLAREGEA